MNQPVRRERFRSLDRFNLVEFCVPALILIVIIILSAGLAEGVSKLWHDMEPNNEASRDAGSGLQLIAQDLHSAVITTNSSSLFIKSRANEGEQLFFLTYQREDDHRGNLSAVGYFIAKEPDGDGVPNLYRFHALPDEVATALQRGSLEHLYATASPANKSSTELIARHIVRLDVRDPTIPSGNGNIPEVLCIEISAARGEVARLLAGNPMAMDLNTHQLQRKFLCFSSFIRLPNSRNLQNGK